MIDAVIFDMDGLLVDSEYVTFLAYKEMCLTFGKSFDMIYYATFLGRNAAYIESSLASYLDNKDQAKEVMHAVHRIVEKQFEQKGVPLKRGVKDLINYLKQEGIKIGVATSSHRKRATSILDKAGILDAFSVMVCGDEVKFSKPDPEIFLKTASALKVSPTRSIVLEDSESGINAAHLAGMRCINIPDLKAPSKSILEKADYIAEDLVEVIEYIKSLLRTA